ncbi:MAG: DMT family transporter [Alphaproteobacteria bacterium]|nr:MAG: DMT family transporter [Alphaproteobacteria bacterium]
MLVFALLISGSFTFGGIIAPLVDPAAMNAVRFAIATVLMAAVITATGRWRPGRPGRGQALWRFAILGGLLGAYFVLMFEALRLTDPVSTSAVFTLTPLISAGFGYLFLRQISSPLVLTSLVLAGAGAIWVIFRGDIEAIVRFDVGPGEMLFFIGCVCHAAYTPLVPKLNRGEPVILFTFGTLAGGTLLVGIYGWQAIFATDWTGLPPVVYAGIFYLAVFTTAGTFFLVQFAAMRLPAGKAMAYVYLLPALVMIQEGLLGHGWAAPRVLPGIAATIVALLILLRKDGPVAER